MFKSVGDNPVFWCGPRSRGVSKLSAVCWGLDCKVSLILFATYWGLGCEVSLKSSSLTGASITKHLCFFVTSWGLDRRVPFKSFQLLKLRARSICKKKCTLQGPRSPGILRLSFNLLGSRWLGILKFLQITRALIARFLDMTSLSKSRFMGFQTVTVI